MIRLSAFADEISQNPLEQIDVLAAHGIKYIEFRAIHGTNVLDLGDDQHTSFRDLLQSHGVRLERHRIPHWQDPHQRAIRRPPAAI